MTDQTEKPIKTVDAGTELAKERTHAAIERTLMAWIRTGLSMIGFGIGIIEFIQKSGGNSILRSSKVVGLLFLLLGIIAVVFAIRDSKLSHERLLNNDYKYYPKSSLGTKVGYALIGIGILAIIHVTYKFFNQ